MFHFRPQLLTPTGGEAELQQHVNATHNQVNLRTSVYFIVFTYDIMTLTSVDHAGRASSIRYHFCNGPSGQVSTRMVRGSSKSTQSEQMQIPAEQRLV